MAMIRESQIMKIHYITAIGALIVVAVHIMMRIIMPYNMSLEYENVVANYHNIPYAHLAGINTSLDCDPRFQRHASDTRSNCVRARRGRTALPILTIVAMMAVVAYGTRTILLAQGLGFE